MQFAMMRLYGMTTLAILVSVLSVYEAFPDSRYPNSEYELINLRAPEIQQNKTFYTPTAAPRPGLVITPPPPPGDSKNFVYDPVAKTWKALKNNGPPPAEDALIWNQNNDKWLTMVPRT